MRRQCILRSTHIVPYHSRKDHDWNTEQRTRKCFSSQERICKPGKYYGDGKDYSHLQWPEPNSRQGPYR